MSLEANLQVTRPHAVEVTPSLTPMENITVEEGAPVRLITVVAGTPTPTVQWFREGTLIPHSRDFEVSSEFF